MASTTDLYVETIAKKFKTNEYYWNTKMCFDSKDNLISIDYKVDQPILKMKQFEEWSVKHGLLKEDCAIIGDGDSDTLLLKELGLPILLITQYTNEDFKNMFKTQISTLTEVMKLL